MGLEDDIKVGGETYAAYVKKKQLDFYNKQGLLDSIGKHSIDGLVEFIAEAVFSTLSYYNKTPHLQYTMAQYFKEVLTYTVERADCQPTYFPLARNFQLVSIFSSSEDSLEAWNRIKRVVKYYKDLSLDFCSTEEGVCRHFISMMTKECVAGLATSCLNDLNLQNGSDKKHLFQRKYEIFLGKMNEAESRARTKALECSPSTEILEREESASAEDEDHREHVPKRPR